MILRPSPLTIIVVTSTFQPSLGLKHHIVRRSVGGRGVVRVMLLVLGHSRN